MVPGSPRFFLFWQVLKLPSCSSSIRCSFETWNREKDVARFWRKGNVWKRRKHETRQFPFLGAGEIAPGNLTLFFFSFCGILYAKRRVAVCIKKAFWSCTQQKRPFKINLSIRSPFLTSGQLAISNLEPEGISISQIESLFFEAVLFALCFPGNKGEWEKIGLGQIC